MISDLQLPAKVLVAAPHISLEGVPLLGEPAAELQHEVWLEAAPEMLEASGEDPPIAHCYGQGDRLVPDEQSLGAPIWGPLVDYAFNYETVLLGPATSVRMSQQR